MSAGPEGHILFSVLIIGCLAKVASFSFIYVMEPVIFEVVLSLVNVWLTWCPMILLQCKFLSKIVRTYISYFSIISCSSAGGKEHGERLTH